MQASIAGPGCPFESSDSPGGLSRSSGESSGEVGHPGSLSECRMPGLPGVETGNHLQFKINNAMH